MSFFCIMPGFKAVLPSLPYLYLSLSISLSISISLYRRSSKAAPNFISWFDKNGFNSMCFYQCAFKVEKFMISGRNNSCSRMGLERKLCRLIPWDFRSPINSYQDPSLVHPGTKPQKILSLFLFLSFAGPQKWFLLSFSVILLRSSYSMLFFQYAFKVGILIDGKNNYFEFYMVSLLHYLLPTNHPPSPHPHPHPSYKIV